MKFKYIFKNTWCFSVTPSSFFRPVHPIEGVLPVGMEVIVTCQLRMRTYPAPLLKRASGLPGRVGQGNLPRAPKKRFLGHPGGNQRWVLEEDWDGKCRRWDASDPRGEFVTRCATGSSDTLLDHRGWSCSPDFHPKRYTFFGIPLFRVKPGFPLSKKVQKYLVYIFLKNSKIFLDRRRGWK